MIERSEHMLDTLKSLTEYILLGYFIYILLTGVILFSFSPQTGSLASDLINPWIKETTEKAVLIEDRAEALKVRLDLMNEAEETLDIAYYSMQGGETVDLFYAHILQAADRGVKVRFLADGLFHNMRFGHRDVIRLFTEHPNIELSFYEPLDLIRPWTWHNRLHDKFMIADQSTALMGGRNIGDKYFAPDQYQGVSNDRDLLLLGQSQNETPIIGQMQTYFDFLWSHDYTEQQTDRRLNAVEKKRAQRIKTKIMATYQDYFDTNQDFFTESIDWEERSHEINGGFIAHNSVERLFKEPQVWRQLLELFAEAEEQVVIQSPYIIPSRLMREDMKQFELDLNQGLILTNGLAATPNIIAHSGYRNHREGLAQTYFDLYEYQDDNQSLHMKSIVIDQQVTIVGSFNLDPRSVYLNTESMLIIDSPTLSQEIIATIEEEYLPESLLIEETDHVREMNKYVSVLKKMLVLILRPLTRLVEFLL